VKKPFDMVLMIWVNGPGKAIRSRGLDPRGIDPRGIDPRGIDPTGL